MEVISGFQIERKCNDADLVYIITGAKFLIVGLSVRADPIS